MVDIMCVNEITWGRFQFRTVFGDIVLKVDGKITQHQLDMLSNILTTAGRVGLASGVRAPQHDCIRSARAKARNGYPGAANALAALEAQELTQLRAHVAAHPELATHPDGPGEEDGPWAEGYEQRQASAAPLVDVVITPEQATAHRERKPPKVTVDYPQGEAPLQS